jgi:hypothetical protein
MYLRPSCCATNLPSLQMLCMKHTEFGAVIAIEPCPLPQPGKPSRHRSLAFLLAADAVRWVCDFIKENR